MSRHMDFDELLASIPEPDRSRLAMQVEERRYRAGEFVFRQGDPADALYCVLTGWVRIVVDSGAGHQLIVAPLVQPREIFGEIAVLDGGPRTAGAVAGADCRLALLRRTILMDTLRAQPEVALAVIGLLCKRLRHVSDSVETTAFLSAPSRLAKCLLHLATRNGIISSTGTRLGLRFSQQELASMVATTRELVNKLLKCWEREKRLKLERGCVVEVCPAALSELVDDAQHR